MDKWIRHGDVIITRITAEEYENLHFPHKSDTVIAYGEATGHHHKLQAKAGQAQVLVNKSQETQAFSVKNDTKLVHEEHKTVTIPKGYYKVEFEKEYEPLEQIERQVYD
tara:strand:- start:200 stop:526 length:327 start_codon:yes stop_codon:yes gene_type:complete